MDSGFIKIHRSLNEWGWKRDHKTLALWVHLLLNANWKDGHYMGHKLYAGDIVVGRKSLSAETGLSPQEIRTCLEKLEKTGEIRKQATNKFTVLTIVKWEEYQFDREQATSNDANKQPTSNQQATTNKEGKKERIIKDNTNVLSKKPDDVSDETWKSFLQLRKSKKAPVTDLVIRMIANECQKAKWDMESALAECCLRGWQSFKAEFVKEKPKPKINRTVL